MSGYDPGIVRYYLSTFAEVKGEKPWSIEFLDHAMQRQNMSQHSLFARYIVNKLPANKQKEYLARLAGHKEEFTKGVGSGDGIMVMYFLYAAGTLINVGLIVFVFTVNLMIAFNVLIAAAVFGIQMLAIFMHNRIYGNRLGISNNELVLLCMFLSSIAAAIGGVIIGGLT